MLLWVSCRAVLLGPQRMANRLAAGSDVVVAAERAQQEAADLRRVLVASERDVETLRKELADAEAAKQDLRAELEGTFACGTSVGCCGS